MNAIERADSNPTQYFQNGLNVTYQVLKNMTLPSSTRFYPVFERALESTDQDLCDIIEAELGGFAG